MDVTITEVSPNTLEILRTLAEENGQTLEEYIRSRLESDANRIKFKKGNFKRLFVPPEDKQRKKEWLDEFDDWMEELDPNTPNLTDEQISRESIYEEQIQRQR
jgi:hypothetical protein